MSLQSGFSWGVAAVHAGLKDRACLGAACMSPGTSAGGKRTNSVMPRGSARYPEVSNAQRQRGEWCVPGLGEGEQGVSV